MTSTIATLAALHATERPYSRPLTPLIPTPMIRVRLETMARSLGRSASEAFGRFGEQYWCLIFQHDRV
jgi:hypothetical protein